MNDILQAREQLLAYERQRPRPGQSSVYWEDGRWWRRAFDELTTAEHTFDASSTAQADGAPVGSDTAARRLMSLADVVRQSTQWYRSLLARLQQTERAWGVDQQGRSLAPRSLREHLALVDLQIHAYEVRDALIALEYLEHRRRANGGLDEGQWQQAWSAFYAALRAQNAAYKRRYNQELPERIRAERLIALERIYRMQADTREQWANWRDVDMDGLDADMHAVARFIESLRPGQEARRNIPALVLAGVVVLLVAALANQGGQAQTGATPTAAGLPDTPVAAQQSEAQAVQVGAQGPAAPVAPVAERSDQAAQYNAAGVALLRQGRCEEATRAFDQALNLAPTWHEPYSNKAFCLYELGDRETAMRAWGLALDLNPHSPDANAGLGMALAAAGDRAQGQQYYDRAVALDPLYRDAARLRGERFWSERAIADSAPLRGEGGQAPAATPTISIPPKGAP